MGLGWMGKWRNERLKDISIMKTSVFARTDGEVEMTSLWPVDKTEK